MNKIEQFKAAATLAMLPGLYDMKAVNAKMQALVLTKDDLALAIFACGFALSFWKAKGRSKYVRAEAAKYAALAAKLNQLLDMQELS